MNDALPIDPTELLTPQEENSIRASIERHPLAYLITRLCNSLRRKKKFLEADVAELAAREEALSQGIAAELLSLVDSRVLLRDEAELSLADVVEAMQLESKSDDVEEFLLREVGLVLMLIEKLEVSPTAVRATALSRAREYFKKPG